MEFLELLQEIPKGAIQQTCGKKNCKNSLKEYTKGVPEEISQRFLGGILIKMPEGKLNP